MEKYYNVKAALITVLILTADQMTMCNVKCVACSDEPIEIYKLS